MVNLTKEDKKYINSNKGASYYIKGLSERLFMIRKNYGKKGVEKIEKEMQNLGYDFNISELKKKKVMPYDLFIAFLVVETKLFDYDDKKLRAIGREMTSVSYITRFLSKFLISPEALQKRASKMWKKYNPGELEVKEMDEKNKRAAVEIRSDQPGHPFFCRNLEGYFEGIFSLVIGKDSKCREEKCPFKDRGNVHRFIITW